MNEQTIQAARPILVGNIPVEVGTEHGPDWFPVRIGTLGSRLSMTLYLRRSELRALRDRLDEIDRGMPEPER